MAAASCAIPLCCCAAQRVAVDSLSALERVSNLKCFRQFVIGLTAFIKDSQIAGLFTATTERLLGGESVTEAHISTITDSIIRLRDVKILGEIKRGLRVLKMRGSPHDKDIREFSIDGSGRHIGYTGGGYTGGATAAYPATRIGAHRGFVSWRCAGD